MTSPVYVPTHVGARNEQRWALDVNRGVRGMYGVIATEASLFVCLFASYYFLGSREDRWKVHEAPALLYASILLVVLLASSFVLHWGESQLSNGSYGPARTALWLTFVLGLIFIVLQGFEYAKHLRELTPQSDAYGSIFYTITTFHAAHVIVGLVILAFVGFLPRYGPTPKPPYRPYHVAALYWHFVDIVWIFIVALLYVIPNVQVHMR